MVTNLSRNSALQFYGMIDANDSEIENGKNATVADQAASHSSSVCDDEQKAVVSRETPANDNSTASNKEALPEIEKQPQVESQAAAAAIPSPVEKLEHKAAPQNAEAKVILAEKPRRRPDFSKIKVDPMISLPPRHPAYFIIGKKGFGKSALVEAMGEVYWWLDEIVLDWNGAFDLESLHWCVKGDPWRDKKGKTHEGRTYPILLIVPSTKIITTDGRQIQRPDTKEMVLAVKTISDAEPLEKILQMAYHERRVCVFSIYLYKDPTRGQYRLADMLKALPVVMRDKMPDYVNCCLLLRELADIASNKMKTFAGNAERETKRNLALFFRQARHARTTIIADMQNPDDIYASIEVQEDFILVKRLNRHHVPEKLGWLINDIENRRRWAASHYILNRLNLVSLDHLSRNSFYCIWPEGHYTLEHNRMPRFRHHATNDNAKKLAGIVAEEEINVEKSTAKSAELKMAEMQQKKEEKENYIDKLSRAMALYIRKKKENPNYTWKECAADKDIKFYGQDGKTPSGETLSRQINRYGRVGKLPGYEALQKLEQL
jgi:hypothetical protein